MAEKTLPGLKLFNRGKVRDIYDLGDKLLLVASDRISAFDVILPTLIPDKGKILTALSVYWFGVMQDIIPHHLITTNIDEFPAACQPHRAELEGRTLLVKKSLPAPVECIVRGYLVGSGWKDYQQTGTVCGIPLPKGLVEASRLDHPIFTPSTKAPVGAHDVNITFDEMVGKVGKKRAEAMVSRYPRPIKPTDFVVLTISVVIAALRAGELVASEDHVQVLGLNYAVEMNVNKV